MTGTTASPLATASAPPGQKSFCTSMISSKSSLALNCILDPRCDDVKGGRTGMGCGKGAVALRMPILGQHDMVEVFSQAIDHGHHGIAVGHRKRTARAEIVLHVDDQQQIVAGP